MRLESPWMLLLFLLLPLAAYIGRRRNHTALPFSSIENALEIAPSLRVRLMWIPQALRTLAIGLIIISLARPQKGTESVRDLSKGVAIEMVVDRSGSMQQQMNFDGQAMTRLDVVKKVFDEFINGNKRDLKGRPNDLVGMIAFARYPDTSCPLTLGHGTLSHFLKRIKFAQTRAEDGTAIGDAVALAAARLKTAEETLARMSDDKRKDYEIKSKIIIVLTDGQQNRGKRHPLEAAELAKKWGIKIYTIGIGGRQKQRGLLGMIMSGSSVDTQTLSAMAKATGGVFRMAEDADSMRSIYEEIDKLEKSEVESLKYLNYRERFAIPVIAAVVLLGLEVLLGATFFRRMP